MRVLAIPAAYRVLGVLIGARAARETLAREYLRPERGQRVLDIGCGTGELSLHLAGVEYVGFDASPDYIRAARERHPHARFECRRIEEHVVEPESFDLAVAIGVLHHLDDAEVLGLLRLAERSLRRGGRLVTLDGCYVEGQSRVARFLLARDRGARVREPEQYLRLVRRVFPNAESHVREDLLRVPYTHVVIQCSRV
jgi:SAM-dependent methyltransferase